MEPTTNPLAKNAVWEELSRKEARSIRLNEVFSISDPRKSKSRPYWLVSEITDLTIMIFSEDDFGETKSDHSNAESESRKRPLSEERSTRIMSN